ncbi:MAG TPA: SGNH/GDSL hydrolase family protein [Cyclobacteriaceae bacterium]|nr:SGNH/GDSL hydrolase family protein [Cyclobacteriaceae bacterium]
MTYPHPRALLFCFIAFVTVCCDDPLFPWNRKTKQDNNYYEFEKERVIKNLGTFKIKSVYRSAIIFDKEEGDLTDKNIWNRGDSLGFNIDMLYRFKLKSDLYSGYFRMYWQKMDKGETTLYIHWLDLVPYGLNTEATIEIVDVPFVQKGKTSVCTIGDSQTWLFDGENYRYKWSELNHDFRFIGNRTDYWGFGHEGEGGNTSADVIARMQRFKPADIYVLLIGTNDRSQNLSMNRSVENIETITNHLYSVNPSARVYVLTIPPCVEALRDRQNRRINELLKAKTWKNTTVLDVETLFRSQSNWTEYFSDGLHPNEEGYRLLTGFLNEKIR